MVAINADGAHGDARVAPQATVRLARIDAGIAQPKLFDRSCPNSATPADSLVSNEANLGLGSLLGVDGSLLTHGSENDDVWYFVSGIHATFL